VNIELLRLANLRCFESVDFTPGPAINWLIGANGAGKTTLLEAAHLLSHGRSFRAGGRAAPCRHGAAEFTIHAELSCRGHHRLGMTRRDERWQARLDGIDLSTLVPLFEVCPVVYFGPESLSLILGAAEERRSFLDWSVFHVEQGSLNVWRRWRRVLRQRNALLRDMAADTLFEPWEYDLGLLASQIHRMRRACIASLEPYLIEESAWLVPELGAVHIAYRAGWDETAGLAAELASSRRRDRERGFTQKGAHRADWSLHFSHVAQREHLSRGQAKAVALACILAQTRWLKDRTAEHPLLCLDDLGSELDAAHADKVVGWLTDQPIQAWLTSTGAPPTCRGESRVFHVEHTGLTPSRRTAVRPNGL
jgi:DNA replication and repair protein RecF